jgi:hypothetical protein
LKNILFWTNAGEEERAWANKTGLVGLFEVEWKTLHHNILVEFLNWKLDFEHKKIKFMLGEEQKIINKHLLVEVFKIYHTGEIKANQVEMLNDRVTLADIANKVLNIYNTNEGWVVKKMRSEYATRIGYLQPIVVNVQ